MKGCAVIAQRLNQLRLAGLLANRHASKAKRMTQNSQA